MLIQTLRNMTRPLMLATLILIIPSFIVLYGSSAIQQKKQTEQELALRVNDSPIYMDEFYSIRANQIRMMKSGLGDQWTDEMEDAWGISEKTVDNIIGAQAVTKRTEELGIRVSKGSLRDSVVKMFSSYFPSGRWDPLLYKRLVESQTGMPVREFERRYQENLADQRAREFISMGYHVTDAEIKKLYARENTQYEVEYVRIPVSDFEPEVKVTDAALATHFENNKDAYAIPEGVRVRYLHFSAADFESMVNPTESELKDYLDQHGSAFEVPEKTSVDCFRIPDASYEAFLDSGTQELHEYYNLHRQDFEDPEQYLIGYTYIPVGAGDDCPALTREEVRAKYEKSKRQYEIRTEQAKVRQILCKAATPWAEQAAVAKIKSIREEILKGKSFADAAKESSEDANTKGKGGDLGWVEMHGFGVDPKIVDAAFGLPIGEVSEPILTRGGYVLLLVTERRSSGVKPFEEVEAAIRKEMARQRLTALRDRAEETGLTPDLLVEGSFPAVYPEKFSAKAEKIDDVLGDKNSRWVTSSLRAVLSGKLTRVIESPDMDKSVVAQMIEKTPARTWTYEEAEKDVRIALAESKAAEKPRERGADLAGRAKEEGVTFESLAAEAGATIVRSGTFEKGDTLPFLGDKSEEFISKAAGINKGGIDTVEVGTDVYVVHVTGREDARVPSLEEVRNEVTLAVRRETAGEQAENYLASIRDLLLDFNEMQQGKTFPEEKRELYGEVSLATAVLMAKKELDFDLPSGVYGELAPDRFITDKDLEMPITVPVLGWTPDVSLAALLLKKPGDRSGIMPVNREPGGSNQKPTDFFLLELVEHREARPAQSMEEVREQVENDYIEEESASLAEARAEEVVAALDQKIKAASPADATAAANLKTLGRELNVEYVPSRTPFTLEAYYSAFPRMDRPVWILKTIENMQVNELSGLIENENRVWEQYGPIFDRKRRIKELLPEGYYIVHLLSKLEPDWNSFDKSRAVIAKRLAAARRGQEAGGSSPVLESWIEALKKQAKVEKSKRLNDILVTEKEKAEGIVPPTEKTD